MKPKGVPFWSPIYSAKNNHTISFSGSYIYLEASAPRTQGDRCWLQSQNFAPTKGSCVSFWYNMYGPNIGTLSVYALYSTGTNRTLWTLSGDQGNTWKNGQAPVASGVSFTVCWYSYCKILYFHILYIRLFHGHWLLNGLFSS